MAAWKQEKVFIPHNSLPVGGSLCGILQTRVDHAPGARIDRKITLLCHGQMCHKNSLYHPALADALPMDSFRVDFRGNAESPAPWSLAGFERDIEDLEVVAAWLVNEKGYEIDTVITHSRGSLTAMKWISMFNSKWNVKRFIPIAPRYRMELIHDRDPIYNPAFASQGYYIATEYVRRQKLEFRITPDMVDDFASWDTGYVKRGEFPSSVQVLIIGAEKDNVMPLQDSILFARDFESRPGGLVSWCMIEGANHMFKGCTPQVVKASTRWMELSLQGERLPKFWSYEDPPKGRL